MYQFTNLKGGVLGIYLSYGSPTNGLNYSSYTIYDPNVNPNGRFIYVQTVTQAENVFFAIQNLDYLKASTYSVEYFESQGSGFFLTENSKLLSLVCFSMSIAFFVGAGVVYFLYKKNKDEDDFDRSSLLSN